jgi:hypothetical protein
MQASRRRPCRLGLIALAFLAYSSHDQARSTDDQFKAALAVWGHIQLVEARLGICADSDPHNGSAYLLVATEYLRNKEVTHILVTTETLMDTELRRLPADLDKAKAARKQGLDMNVEQIRKNARDASDQFVQGCHTLLQNFMHRQGPFRSLEVIFPKEIQAIEMWRIYEKYCGGGACR